MTDMADNLAPITSGRRLAPGGGAMSDIGEMVAWLRVQLDDDERIALGAEPGPWTLDLYGGGLEPMACVMAPIPQQPGAKTGLTQLARVPSQPAMTAEHIARHDPAHELNIVAAHRRLLDLAGDLVADAADLAAEGDPEWMTKASTAQYIRRTLAAGYAGRDGYREGKP